MTIADATVHRMIEFAVDATERSPAMDTESEWPPGITSSCLMCRAKIIKAAIEKEEQHGIS